MFDFFYLNYRKKWQEFNMKLKDIAIKRIYSQHIKNQKLKHPSELVSWLGAVQAQDYSGAKWSVGLRLSGTTDKNVEQALKDRKLVRTWALRGTLHFVAASDIRWLLSLLAPRIISRNTRRYKELKLDESTLSMSNNILKSALNDGKYLNRRELLDILKQNGISTEGQRAAYMLQRASLEGIICQTITHMNNPLYISMEELNKSTTLERVEALAELATQYFNGHGPATLEDFVWWSGLLKKDAREGLDNIKSILTSENISEKTYWMSPDSSENFESPTVKLLPGFDEYLLSYRDRSASISTEQIKERLSPTNGIFSSTVIIDGQVVGTWKRKFKKDEVSIKINYFRKFTTSEESALKSEVNSYAEFLDMPIIRE
jgi:hypothetical protein